MQIDTFSAHSLKILDKNKEEFENIFLNNLSFFKKDEKAAQGSKFHSLICSYIKGFDTSYLINDLNEEELYYWYNLEKKLAPIKHLFVKTEYSFLIKEKFSEKKDYFLTGRFDAILKDENENLIIYDWKTLNLPKDPKNDLQTIMYLYCCFKIFKTKKIIMRYLSIEKLNSFDVTFENEIVYMEKIKKIISKIY